MNRIVVVTGASSGLGLSLSKLFIKEGDTVYGITRTKKSWTAAKKILPSSNNFHLHQSDLSIERNVQSLISKISRREKRIDILINNAGYANRRASVEKETLRELQRNLSANLITSFLMCKHALPLFKKQREGWIINISSMAGKRAVPFLGAYSISKFAVVALTQSMAKENPDAGFKCVTVCPGGMNTGMRSKIFGTGDARRQQNPDYVAQKILEMVKGEIRVPSGGDISIRHGQVTAIDAPPAP